MASYITVVAIIFTKKALFISDDMSTELMPDYVVGTNQRLNLLLPNKNRRVKN